MSMKNKIEDTTIFNSVEQLSLNVMEVRGAVGDFVKFISSRLKQASNCSTVIFFLAQSVNSVIGRRTPEKDKPMQKLSGWRKRATREKTNC